MSTLFVNNLNTASGSTITVPTGKQLIVTDQGGMRVPGSVIQVVNSINTTHASSNTASWAATDVAATITPKYNTSKILVQFTGAIRVYNSSGANASGAWRIYRSVGGASFAQVGTHQLTHRFYDYGSSGIIADQPFHMQYLDSPSTTSAVIYKLYWYKEAGTAMEYNPDGQDETYTTLMEIAQ